MGTKSSSRVFSGFPAGKLGMTAVPNLFFSDLLPEIDHLGELKISLYAFWALSRGAGEARYFTRSQALADDLLRRALAAPGTSPVEAVDDALERAVARGTLLKAEIEVASGREALFFLNSSRGRAAVEAMVRGEWRPSGDAARPVELRVERPNIFSLYEQNIGPLTPMIAETLRDAEQSYPASWIEEAVRIAVENNVRKWSYIRAILEAWQTRGKDDREDRGDTEKARRRYVEGEFAKFFKR